MTTCRDIDELLLASLDQPLEPGDQDVVNAHLAECGECVSRMKDYVVTTQILRGLGPKEEADVVPLAEGLVTRILAARKAEVLAERRSRTG
jgi:anti-sigma factor RsiW